MPPSPRVSYDSLKPGEGASTLRASEGWAVQGGVARTPADRGSEAVNLDDLPRPPGR